MFPDSNPATQATKTQGEVVTVYAGEQPPDQWTAAVFCAGPSPRQTTVASWRPDAVRLFHQRWAGPGQLVVFVPEGRDRHLVSYDGQIDWEQQCLHLADAILFWIPRDLERLPGFTTNIEWGYWQSSGKCVLGAPSSAANMSYLRHYADKLGVPQATTLPDTVDATLRLIGPGAQRADGARHAPLSLWATEPFTNWFTAQEQAGHRVLDGQVCWSYPPGATRPVFWAYEPRLEVAGEDRIKCEVVIGRPDVHSVVAYRPALPAIDTQIVLVREYRAAATTPDGYVYELPGGSSHDPRLPSARQALAELAEETGIVVEAGRLRPHGSRQQLGTLLAHHQHLHSVELTDAEMAAARADTTTHGVAAETEQTTVRVVTLAELLAGRFADMATLGAVMQVLTDTHRLPEPRGQDAGRG